MEDKVAYKEINNQNQGKSGCKVKTVTGPAVGKASGNASNGGGIAKPTNGKYK